MKLPVKIRLKQMNKETLFEAYQHEEVLTYCQSCSNYEKNYSCPDFDFDAVSYLEPYHYATVILTEIDTEPIQSQIDRLDVSGLSSRVLESYQKEKPDETVDMTSVISMYAFNSIKDQMADQLIELEKEMDHTIGLPPGSCTKCVVCSKLQGEPCRFIETLRYSLEALGFLVSEIYKRSFDLELGWAKNTLPERFCSCSVLMSKERIDETMILNELEGMVLEINEE